jgi:hypothetical protein
MRLFEVALDYGRVRGALEIRRDQANQQGTYASVPMMDLEDALADSPVNSVAAMQDLATLIDPDQNLIKAVVGDDNDPRSIKIILNTDTENPDDPGDTVQPGTGPSVDQMAASNTDLSPKI